MVLPVLLLAGAFLLGGLPLSGWLVRALTGKDLRRLGTGNVGVSAAFIHAGRWVGILAALAEAARGIVVVLIASGVAGEPDWPLLALSALVAGRYWLGRGAGVTNAFWGLLVYAPTVTYLVGLIWLVPLVIWRGRRGRRRSQLATLIALPLVFYGQSGSLPVTAAAALLALWLGYALVRLPDDMEREQWNTVLNLDQPLDPEVAGFKAANLAQLRRAGVCAPAGWVLPAGKAAEALLALVFPSAQRPWIARSSATGEDGSTASAAGQYLSVANLTTAKELLAAVDQVRASHDAPAAVQYRRDRGIEKSAMAVLVQPQIQGVYSGVVFTRDPVSGDEALVVEAVAGGAAAVVGGQITPLRAIVDRSDTAVPTGEIPANVLEALRDVALAVERCFAGKPQDIEWTFDGERIWVLQARPITTLQPVWTRTIAAEVIPGTIRPLTWSINQPLTCGVWGEIFKIVLGGRARGIDFNQTATLLEGWAYFNATLLTEIFQRMGLPPESLDFLYRGSRFSRPPLTSVMANLPGLLRLAGRDLELEKDFRVIDQDVLAPLLAGLAAEKPEALTPGQLIGRAERIVVACASSPTSISSRPWAWRSDERCWRYPRTGWGRRRALKCRRCASWGNWRAKRAWSRPPSIGTQSSLPSSSATAT